MNYKKLIGSIVSWCLLGVAVSDPFDWVKAEPTGLGLFLVMTSIILFIVALGLFGTSFED